jgi:glycosyltransferase involved in cell wall biosynthesis
VHLIAQSLHKSSRIPWIADFRDPWTDIYHFDDINKTYIVKKIENKMEQDVINNCNLVITVSEHFKKIFEEKTKDKTKFRIITNGFDTSDFNKIKYNKSPKFTLAYSGKLSAKQNPLKLWEGISNFIQEHPEIKKTFQISLTGKFDSTVHTSIKNNNLQNIFVDNGYVSHEEAIKNILKADVLIIIIPDTKKNKGILPGKLFEYMAAERYIIGIGPEDSDMATILKETNSGIVLPFFANFTPIIKELYYKWERKKQLSLTNKKEINKYSRFELTKSLASEMDVISSERQP